jgi:excisionase family DNA binding protein
MDIISTGQYVSVREAAQILAISEKKVMDLIDEKTLLAYRIANQFLRLKKSDVLSLRNSGSVAAETVQHPYTAAERFKDFFYFNDFYLVSIFIILILINLILFG